MTEAAHLTDSKTGLTSSEAARRLEQFGPNEISSSRLKSRIEEVAKIFLDPMGLMLLGLAALYAILGAKADSLLLLIAWIPVTAIDVILEIRASAALKALKATLSPVAKVLRDSKIQDVLIRDIVPGDILILEEGQTLPADGTLVDTASLNINESILTGESVPVEKHKGQDFYGGTHVLTGRGLGLITKTGKDSRFGKIATMIESVEATSSPLKTKVDLLVRRILVLAGILALLLFVLEFFRTQIFLSSLIVALTFGMSTVPEEFPLVFTLYLSLGARRLARKRVLVKSLPSVEALGSVDILCTDKTGTLTEGRFQLETLNKLDPSISESIAWNAALLACEPHPVDSMERAIFERATEHLATLSDWKLVFDYPFEKIGKHMTHVWQNLKTGTFRTVMKGSVEGILEHCSVSKPQHAMILELVNRYASQGKRLLALAMREGGASGNRETDERDLLFLGILVFSDPLRPSVINAIAECQSAGIEIKMLTGDHPLTSHYIADEAGIKHSHEFLFTGDELTKMDAPSRRNSFLKGAVFSRVLPEQKHEMIQVLRAEGRVVAMIGDGVNDAPALKLADIGISMGHSASDVARSCAQIVLLDSDFSGVVAAMLEGRRILSNLRRSFSYLISFHLPVIFLALIPPLLGWPPLLLPVHIILLELVVHPISAFTFENLPVTKKETLQRTSGFLDQANLVTSVASGLIVSAGCLILYGYLKAGVSVEAARGAAFSAILIGNISFVAGVVRPHFNLRFLATGTALLALVALIAFLPLPMFHFEKVGLFQTLLALFVGALGCIPAIVLQRSSQVRRSA